MHPLRSLCFALLLLAVPAMALAGSTRMFTLDDAETFAKGELEGTAVHSRGSLRPAARKERTALAGTPVAWCALPMPDGSLLIGAGNDGKILRVRGSEVKVFAETKELVVTSLASDGRGTIYAGTLPAGRIYKVDAAGKAARFAEPAGIKHIWSLLWDDKSRSLIAATGPLGHLLRIDGSGKATVLHDDDAAHLVALARDKDGALYVGTSDTARVLRVRDGRPAEVVYDFPGNEVTALAVRDGEVLAAASTLDAPRVPAAAAEKGDKKDKDGEKPARPGGEGQLWRVLANGRAERLHEAKKDYFVAVGFGAKGSYFAGSGKEGQVLEVLADGSSSVWLDVDERQVRAFSVGGERPFAVASDSGAVYWLKSGGDGEHLWTSHALDTGAASRFGELSWRGRGSLAFETRSGNTEKPDGSWTPWSGALDTPGPVRSPAARYLQVRARLKSADAEVYAVTAHYARHNERAVVSSISVEPKGGAEKDKDATSPPKPSSALKLTWKAENPDNDPLRYVLRFRAEGSSTTRAILPPHVIHTSTTYEWDTISLPDGHYVVEVEASDELANPPELTERFTLTSEPFLVDNHSPAIDDLRVDGSTITGRASDTLGPVARLEAAIDGGPWQVVFPRDGIFDTRSETFSLDWTTLRGGAGKGERILSIRATDAAGNTSTREIVAPAK